MTASDFIRRAMGRKPSSSAPKDGVAARLQLIDSEKGFVTLGQYAREFMAMPYYKVFEDRLQERLNQMHEDLLGGRLSQEAYSRSYLFAKDVLLLAPSTVERGRKAGEQLDEWRKDGTLQEAELLRDHSEE